MQPVMGKGNVHALTVDATSEFLLLPAVQGKVDFVHEYDRVNLKLNTDKLFASYVNSLLLHINQITNMG